jgi:RNA polymerase sigma factor (sigma-70 family)
MASWEPMLEELVRERHRPLIAYAYLLTRDVSDAEDLVQDSLVATFSGRARFESIGHAEAYVRRSIASRYVDTHRKRSREKARVDRVEVRAVEPGHEAAVVGRVDVASALAELPPRVRACVALRYLADQSTAETADALGLSVGAVKRYVSDGVHALNIMLGTVANDDERAPVRSTGGAR